MEKVYDVIGVENPIMDFAVSIDRLPRTDSMSVMYDYLWQSGGMLPLQLQHLPVLAPGAVCLASWETMRLEHSAATI